MADNTNDQDTEFIRFEDNIKKEVFAAPDLVNEYTSEPNSDWDFLRSQF